MKRWLSLLLAVMMILTLFAACTPESPTPEAGGGAAAPGGTAPVPGGTPPAPAEIRDITMRYSWWGVARRHEATIAAIELYQSMNPGITIEAEYGEFNAMLDILNIQLASGTAPDIISLDFRWIFDMMRNFGDSFVNLQDTDIDLSDFNEDFIHRIGGTPDFTIGVPAAMTYQFMAYNPAFIERFGLVDMGPLCYWTWEDYITAGIRVQEQDSNAHMLWGNRSAWPGWMKIMFKQATGMDMVDDYFNLNMTYEDAYRFFDWVDRLVATGTVVSFEHFTPFETQHVYHFPMFLDGNIGAAMQAASHVPAFHDATPFPFGVAMPPVMEGAVDAGAPIGTSMVIAVNANGVAPDEAARFVSWFVNDEEAIRTLTDVRGFPPTDRAQNILVELGLVYPETMRAHERFEAMNERVHPGRVSAFNGASMNVELDDTIYEFVQQVGFRRMDVATATTEFMAAIEVITGRLRASL